MENKEMVQLAYRVSMYLGLVILAATAIWFVLRVVFLVKKRGMAIEDALDSAMNTVTGAYKKLERLPLEIQKAQLTAVSPGFSVCLQYYEVKLKCWLHKIGLL